MLLLAAGGTAQEVAAPAVSPAAATLAVEHKSGMAEGLLLSIVLILAVIAMRVYILARALPRRSVDAGTQTSPGGVPPQEVWIATSGRKAHTRADCITTVRSTVASYKLCKVCLRSGEVRSCG
jgi:hypothetical protein